MAIPGSGPRRVAGGGDAGAVLAVVTDMPDPEDLGGNMLLSGAAGLLFDRMLGAIGLARPAIWLAPLAVARPVAGQVPAADQPALAAILRHQLSLTGAEQLLVMGDAASRALTGTETARARGRFHSVNLGDRTVAVAATFHPRLLLRRPALKAEAWADLQMVAARMTGGGSQCA
ncbi:hypothetical protein GVO57_08145 [Sphingomonas changnyeongensis]|uniref:Uracil-DNA glycosylase-like domain-containing protein n=1 Tax=Sphingomonas changnyeongensis TaxID=2698679 RepID=A0A7Z2NW41_9SPHN|nr:uracil-DNA glycosylase family protein [Sphingomonas changnyeongensis]QHL90802.1 hypothetical protein GVO57_08145 [Sphingomonas changnyeongensis]